MICLILLDLFTVVDGEEDDSSFAKQYQIKQWSDRFPPGDLFPGSLGVTRCGPKYFPGYVSALRNVPRKLNHTIDFVTPGRARTSLRLTTCASTMPGRKSTGPPRSTATKSKRQKPKRSLNALAIAEAENPQQAKIRLSRLGESEPVLHKRSRDDEEEDESEREGQALVGKRRRTGKKDRFGNNKDDDSVEVESDSSGNEWTVGAVDEDDDSELDSDEAFGESDEERFQGFTFRGGSSSKPSKAVSAKRNAASDDPLADGDDYDLREEQISEDGDLDLGEDAVDLVDVLDADSASDTGSSQLSVDEESASNDEDDASEISKDDESVLSFSEDEDTSKDPSKLASLQDLVSNMNPQSSSAEQDRGPIDALQTAAPSEYGINPTRKLTIADIMPSVTDPQLRKSLTVLAGTDSKSSKKRNGIAQKLDVPLPKRQQDRLDRAAAYDKSKETLSRWIDTVKHNRRAEHLSFPIQYPDTTAPEGLRTLLPNTQTKPVSQLETTIQTLLHESGLGPTPGGQSEEDAIRAFEELKANNMPLAEVQARRAELRRARDLLFREEIRARRIKKIKSRSYRKVHRKERERVSQFERDALAAADGEDGGGESEAERERELNDRRRAEERMGARHRESRWAKGVKGSGRAKWDVDARDGVTEMARRDEELRRRIEGKSVDDQDGINSDLDSDASLSDDGNDKTSGQDHNRISRKLDNLVQDPDTNGPGTALANLAFMKRADAARKSRNDEAVAEMRRDLAGHALSEGEDEDENEDGEEEEGDEEEAVGRRSYGPLKQASKQASSKKAVQESRPRNEFEERESPGAAADNGDDGENEEDEFRGLDGDDDTEIVVNGGEVARAGSRDQHHHHQRSQRNGVSNTFTPKPQKMGQRRVDFADDEEEEEKRETGDSAIAGNPWLAGAKKLSNKHSNSNNAGAIISNSVTADITSTGETEKTTRPSGRQEADAKPAAKPSETSTSSPQANGISSSIVTTTITNPAPVSEEKEANDSDNDDNSEPDTTPLERNQSLINRAFATDAVLPAFTAEKAALALSEAADAAAASADPFSTTKTGAQPGWGSWTGAGLSKRDRRIAANKATNTASTGPQQGQQQKNRRQDLNQTRVIRSERAAHKTAPAKYRASALPHPFETRAQYERSLRLPVGPEWSTKRVFQDLTKPRVLVKRGVVVRPLERPVV